MFATSIALVTLPTLLNKMDNNNNNNDLKHIKNIRDKYENLTVYGRSHLSVLYFF